MNMREIRGIQQMFAGLDVCPICFKRTSQRGEIVINGQHVLHFPVCANHLAELHKELRNAGAKVRMEGGN